MSQAVSIPGGDITFKAAADLRLLQFYVVKISAADTINIATARTDVSIGILQNKPNITEHGVVRYAGTSKAKTWGTISRGAYVTATADGRIMTADTDKDHVIGIALTAGVTDGDIIEIMLCHFKASI